MHKNIFFRVDSSHEIGIGHVMRCLALADGFPSEKWQCQFICKSHSGNIKQIIESRGYVVKEMKLDPSFIGAEIYDRWVGSSQEYDANECLKYIDHTGDFLVLDHYGLDVVWEKLLTPKVEKLIVIDDLANRPHDCDLLIDSKYGRLNTEYKNHTRDSTKLLMGSKYCILRKEFSELINKAKEKRKLTKTIKNVLISFGGTDPLNYSELIVDLMMNKIRNLTLDIVIGSHHKSLPKFKSINKKNINLHIDTNEMASLILNSDFSIGGYGGSSWERCCLGLPSFGLVSAKNQIEIAHSLDDYGASKCINESEIFEELNSVLSNDGDFSWWSEMSQKAFNLCDGKGVDRIVSCIEDIS